MATLLLFLVWAAVYVTALPSPPLYDDADSVHAEAAREMVLRNDWVTLHINGIRYLEKAPLMYWLSALSIKALGLSEWAVRLPIALSTLLLALLLLRFGNRVFGDPAGFFAALVYLTSLGPFSFTRILLPDVMLTLCLAACFYFYWSLADQEETEAWRLGSWDLRSAAIFASVALAVLAKGLVGIVFSGTIIFLHLLLSGRWKILRRLQLGRGILVFLLVAAPWHIAASVQNTGFFWFYFVNEHFLRYLGLRYPKDYDTVPLALFWGLHLAWIFPWTALAGNLSLRFPTRLRPAQEKAQFQVFLWIWILTVLVFFSFSTTQEYYSFPVLPAFCLLLGRALQAIFKGEDPRDRPRARTGLAVVAGLGLVAGGTLLYLSRGGGAGGGVANLDATLTWNPGHYALFFGHFFDLTPATLSFLFKLVLGAALLLMLGPLLGWIFSVRDRWKLSVAALVLTMVGLLHYYHAGMTAFAPILASRQFADVINSDFQEGDAIVINGEYESGSSLNFYTGHTVYILNGRSSNLWFGSFYPDAPKIFFDQDESFLKFWKSGRRVFLFSEREPFERFLKRNPDFSYRLLEKSGGKLLVENQGSGALAQGAR